MQISFHGAAQTVTGSKHLITLENNEKILLDCGMFQGMGKLSHELNREFGFDPSGIDYLFLTHAHIDHSGLIPKLAKDGFRGKIYCTPATFDLCKLMLLDSAKIQEADAKFHNKHRKKIKKPLIEPLYAEHDVNRCFELFEIVEYDTPLKIGENIELILTNNGHILGSATINLSLREGQKITKLTYTGDIGGYNSTLLKDPDPFPQANIIICESTYGNRLHNRYANSEQDILGFIVKTCNRNGKVIIPAFSLGRTQEVVFTLNKLNMRGLLPNVKVFVDSPLAVNATEILRNYANQLNDNVQELALSVPDPFGFDWLTYVTDKRDSQKINEMDGPFILISSAGMAEGGRVKHHLMHNIEDPRNAVMLVGYADPLSLAGRLANREKKVTIFGTEFRVNLDVKVIDSLSAHADYEEMLLYLSCQAPEKVSHFFLVHGEPDVQEDFAMKLKQAGFSNISIPERHETIRVK